jgi:hypothetical protein
MTNRLCDVAWGRSTIKWVGEVSFDLKAPQQGQADKADHFVYAEPAFDRLEFQGSIARTKALKRAPPHILRALSASAGPMLSALFDRLSNELAITHDIRRLADATHTALSGDLGAGFADIMMRRFGFVWQANAAELDLPTVNSATSKRPDFAYWAPRHDQTNGIGCLVEAKGTTSSKYKPPKKSSSIVPGYVRKTARIGYSHQIAPFVSAGSAWCGCAIVFGTSAKTQRSYAHCVMPEDIWSHNWDWPPHWWPMMFADADQKSQKSKLFPRGRRLPLLGGDAEVPTLTALLAFRSILALTGHDEEARRVAELIPEPPVKTPQVIDGYLGELEAHPLVLDISLPKPISGLPEPSPPDPARESPIEIDGGTFVRRSSPENPAMFGLDHRVFHEFMRQLESATSREFIRLPFFRPSVLRVGDSRAYLFSDGLLYAPEAPDST